MAQKLKSIAKLIPWSLACKGALLCLAVWFGSPVFFAGAIAVSALWPLTGSLRMMPTAIALIAISLTMPPVSAVWMLVSILTLLFMGVKEVLVASTVALDFLEYVVVATGVVIFFAQTQPFFSPWTVLVATGIAGWLFLILKNKTKNTVRAGISAFVWWQVLLGVLLAPVSVGIQAFLAYSAFVCIAEYQKEQ